jgi:hypothetical protein
MIKFNLKPYSVTFRFYNTDTYCSNIVYAENEEQIKYKYKGNGHHDISVNEAKNYEIDEAKRKGKPIFYIYVDTFYFPNGNWIDEIFIYDEKEYFSQIVSSYINHKSVILKLVTSCDVNSEFLHEFTVYDDNGNPIGIISANNLDEANAIIDKVDKKYNELACEFKDKE